MGLSQKWPEVGCKPARSFSRTYQIGVRGVTGPVQGGLGGGLVLAHIDRTARRNKACQRHRVSQYT